MTKEEFQKLTQNVLLLDGATGSNLMASGMPRGICTEAWIMDHKAVLQNLQKAYVEAGSQIVYAPTFGGNRYSLGLHGLQDKLEEMNHALVNISREAVGHSVYVAGDITTTGKMMEPAGDLTYEMAYEAYCEQIKVLEDAGVDLIAAETMINIEETLAALDAAASVSSLPVMCTMSFAMPENFLEWNPTCHHNKNLLELGQQFVDLFKKQYLYMMYVWGHSYEFTNQNNWEVMEDFCKLVGGRDDIWYATNIEIVDYLDAAKRLQYTADCSHVYNPSAASVWICVNDTNFIELKGGTMTELPIGEWAK